MGAEVPSIHTFHPTTSLKGTQQGGCLDVPDNGRSHFIIGVENESETMARTVSRRTAVKAPKGNLPLIALQDWCDHPVCDERV
jgi:hypothetical protein